MMDRQEAIEQLKNITSVPSMFIDETIKELVEVLEKPITLADFLGWEEGAEYEYEAPKFLKIKNKVLKIENNRLYQKSEECSSGWCNFPLSTDEIEDLRKAKKVEKKETKEELLDELQKYVSSERIDEIIEKLRRLDNE